AEARPCGVGPAIAGPAPPARGTGRGSQAAGLRAVRAARPRQIGMIMSVRTSFTTTAWLVAAAPYVVAVATTEEVSFTAVPANSPNDCWLMPSAWPRSGKASTAAMLNRKIVEIA